MKAIIATAVKWIITVASASVIALAIVAVSVKLGSTDPVAQHSTVTAEPATPRTPRRS